MGCTSVKLYENYTSYAGYFDLKFFCSNLTILDAKTQGIPIDDEPCIDKLQILKCYKDLAPQVENNEGLTLLTMTKGLTLRQLIAIAAEKGISVHCGWTQILEKLGDIPVKQTYVIPITNSVFLQSRSKIYALQENLIAGHCCEIPTVQEYVALCVFTNKCFQKCLYGKDPVTYGRSSTHLEGHPLVVGGAGPDRHHVFYYDFDHEYYGAGGRRRF